MGVDRVVMSTKPNGYANIQSREANLGIIHIMTAYTRGVGVHQNRTKFYGGEGECGTIGRTLKFGIKFGKFVGRYLWMVPYDKICKCPLENKQGSNAFRFGYPVVLLNKQLE